MWAPRLVVPSSGVVAQMQRRSFGIMSSVAGKMQSWTENKKQRVHEDAFKKQINDLARHESFSYQVFYDSIKEQAKKAGATGWRSLVPGVSGREGVKETRDLVDMLGQMTDEERRTATKLDREQRARIATATKLEVSDVNLMQRKYEMMKTMYVWIRAEFVAGRPLPNNPEEMKLLASKKPPSKPQCMKKRTKRRR